MPVLKPPLDAQYFTYDFTSLVGANTITSIQSVDQYAEFGNNGNLINEGQQIVGKTVTVLWAGGAPGVRYMTTVRILDSALNVWQVQIEICVGVQSNCQPCGTQWPVANWSGCGCNKTPCVCPNPDAVAAPVFGGQLKRFIIQRAYGVCGQSVAEFELTTEEYSAALRAMDDLMAQWEDQEGIVLGYNYPTYGEGSPEDESGIPRGATNAVVYALANEIAPQIGKTLSPEANRTYWRTFTSLKSTYTRPCDMGFGRATIQGAGNRWTSWRGPFFQIEKRPFEEIQNNIGYCNCGCTNGVHLSGCSWFNWQYP